MIIKVSRGVIFFLIGMAVCLLAAEDGLAQGCRITLKNGNVISAPHCYEEKGVVYLTKLGGTVGMHKRDVAKIEKVEAEETDAVSVGAPETAPIDREARFRELRGMTAAERKEQQKAAKEQARAMKAARAEEERPYKEFKSLEASLKQARVSEAIACGRALEPMAPLSGPISGEQAAAKIKVSRDATDGCKYYKNQIPKMEKKLEELRSICGSKCQ